MRTFPSDGLRRHIQLKFPVVTDTYFRSLTSIPLYCSGWFGVDPSPSISKLRSHTLHYSHVIMQKIDLTVTMTNLFIKS